MTSHARHEQIFQPGPLGAGRSWSRGRGQHIRAEAGGVVLPIRVQSSVAKSEEKRVSTPPLAAGSYVVTLAHDPAAPGGDADLYVRIGTNPSTSAYDCRPHKAARTRTAG